MSRGPADCFVPCDWFSLRGWRSGACRLVVPARRGTLRSPAALDVSRQLARGVREAAASLGEARAAAAATRPAAKAAATAAACSPSCWLGETGSAQVGGQQGVSGTWEATLWWLDQLGGLALEGTEVQCRQALAGSDYGLLSEETLQPTPDYWASLLWRRLMGGTAFAVALPPTAPRSLRAYCHSARAVPSEPRRRAFLLLNLGAEPLSLRLCVGGCGGGGGGGGGG
eukprot:CAMPEP_0185484950 /NCGR_PEP_ID=MMETSP1366-20130426/9701_1 /TAXON_ID=38817 /ORGANISM="Gephyrocapsa oceanica, Strain RCC1303" /LENGTH=226 /DNA_ID=CAMNT_0028093039 /DNA_START=32 /DNA_END=708 /DNA_ORIENTATION=-